MTRRLRVWVLLLAGNAALIGWCIAERRWVEGIAPLLVQFGAGWIFAGDVDDLVDEEAHQHALDLLAEVIAEHGPMECDPECPCSACRGNEFLLHAGADLVGHRG